MRWGDDLARTQLLSAAILGLIATVVAAVLPMLVSAWQTALGFSAHEAGYIAATELFAQVCGTVLFLRIDRTWSLRRCAGLGLAVMVVGNLACARGEHLWALLASRLIAGLGGGMVRALSPLGRPRPKAREDPSALILERLGRLQGYSSSSLAKPELAPTWPRWAKSTGSRRRSSAAHSPGSTWRDSSEHWGRRARGLFAAAADDQRPGRHYPPLRSRSFSGARFRRCRLRFRRVASISPGAHLCRFSLRSSLAATQTAPRGRPPLPWMDWDWRAERLWEAF